MKKGQIILGTAALVVTAVSTWAFKVANKFGTHHQLYVKIQASPLVCGLCSNIWTKAGGTVKTTTCQTNSGTSYLGAGTGNHIFYTQTNCTNAFSLVTNVH